jgi:LDH2 family malate/lactate/ureidoglycolate dehydrogenase
MALVEILCAVLGGGPFGNQLKVPEDGLHGGYTSHFFGALRIDAMRDRKAFGIDLDRELRTFKESHPVPGAERVMVAGDPEREATERFQREGVPINEKVFEALDAMAERLGIAKLERFVLA